MFCRKRATPPVFDVAPYEKYPGEYADSTLGDNIPIPPEDPKE